MSSRVGVELGAQVIRGVRLDGWPRNSLRVAEVQWNSSDPQEAVRALRLHLGAANHLAVALDLSLLFVKQIKLPPVSAADKAGMLAMEPERFFPVRAEDIVAAARAEDDLVFAARETPLATWISGLGELGAVNQVEPAPIALARALVAAHVANGTVVLDRSDGNGKAGIGVLALQDGRTVAVRRVYGELAEAAAAIAPNQLGPTAIYLTPWNEQRATTLRDLLPTARVEPLPEMRDLPAQFMPAYGAALGVGKHASQVLHSAELQDHIATRRRRDTAIAIAACVAALLFATAAADAWRARSARGLEAGLQRLNARAAPALALQSQLAALQQEARAVTQVAAERRDPLRVLLALSQRLPRGASIRSIHSSGAEWRLEGFAPNAAQLLGLLGATPGFHDVRFLAATTRAVVGARTYESFTLAFRYIPTP